MLIITTNVNTYFINKLELLDCPEIVKSYLVGALSKYKNANLDYSNQSLTLIYYDAKMQMNFEKFQNLGDWIFCCKIMFPQHLQDASQEYYTSLAQFSYYNCYKLINKQIAIYEQLADNFIPITFKAKTLIQKI